MPEFLTIRQAAAKGLVSEYFIRLMVKSGTCPGVYSGNRFLVNFPALAEQLDVASKQKPGGAAQ